MSRIDDLFNNIMSGLNIHDQVVVKRKIEIERKKERNRIVTELVKSVHKLSYGNVSKTKKS